METFALFEAAGVRVIPVEDFDYDAVFIADVRVLLIADDLTSDERHRIASEYLPVALTG